MTDAKCGCYQKLDICPDHSTCRTIEIICSCGRKWEEQCLYKKLKAGAKIKPITMHNQGEKGCCEWNNVCILHFVAFDGTNFTLRDGANKLYIYPYDCSVAFEE